MASAAQLYTSEVLSLATSLAAFPWDEKFQLHGSARSKSCGSTIAMGLDLDDQGRIARVGLKSQACAIGQAASAIFANDARGKDAAEVVRGMQGVVDWLENAGPLPQWSGFATIAAARDYPARHAAILLPWKAAADALPSG